MARIEKATLKTRFETGDTPTENDFINFIDSAVFTDEEWASNYEGLTNTNKFTDSDKNKLTSVTNEATGRAITDADFNNNLDITSTGLTFSYDGVSSNFMHTVSTHIGVTATLTKTGETSRVLEANSLYLVTFFNNVFKISPE